MFQIAIITSNPQIRDSLFYRTKEKADSAYTNIYDILKGAKSLEVIKQEDEFGVTITIDKANVLYAIFADLRRQTELQTLLRSGQQVPQPVQVVNPVQDAPVENGKIIIEQ